MLRNLWKLCFRKLRAAKKNIFVNISLNFENIFFFWGGVLKINELAWLRRGYYSFAFVFILHFYILRNISYIYSVLTIYKVVINISIPKIKIKEIAVHLISLCHIIKYTFVEKIKDCNTSNLKRVSIWEVICFENAKLFNTHSNLCMHYLHLTPLFFKEFRNRWNILKFFLIFQNKKR